MEKRTKVTSTTARNAKRNSAKACAIPVTEHPVFIEVISSGVDEIELQRIKDTYKYPIRLMQKFIFDFFKKLQREKHYLYASLLHLPDDYCRIMRYFDYKLFREERRKKSGLDGCIQPECHSLKSFIENRSAFHRLDEFEIIVFSGRFDRHQIMTQDKLESLYRKFVKEQCEAFLRRDRQIQFTPEVIESFGFTEDDAAIVRKHLNRYNFEARNKIQKEFDALNKLSFLKK